MAYYFFFFRGLNKFYGDADISAKLAEDVLNVLMVRVAAVGFFATRLADIIH